MLVCQAPKIQQRNSCGRQTFHAKKGGEGHEKRIAKSFHGVAHPTKHNHQWVGVYVLNIIEHNHEPCKNAEAFASTASLRFEDQALFRPVCDSTRHVQ